MTAKSKKLVDLLVQKTDLEKDQVEEQLNRLVENIQSIIEKEGDYKIPELGTFTLKDGGIFFEAEDKLATEMNYKYAGMKPIELIGAFKDTPEESVENEEDISAISAFGPGSDVEEHSRDSEPEVEKPVASTHTEKSKEDEEKEIEKKDEPVEKVTASEAGSDLFEESAEDSDENKSAKKVEEKEKEKEKEGIRTEAEPANKGYRSKSKKETKDPIGKILVAAVVISVLGISGWMFYDLGYFGSNSNNNGNGVSESRVAQSFDATPDATENSEDNKADTDSVNSGSEANINETSEQEDKNATSSVTDVAEESRQSVYGLRGGAAPRVTDGYTIVVHSLRDEAKVRRLNEELQKEGYRTVISRAGIQDTTFWRLGLGQFKTVEDATKASQKLPDPYRSNHFIKRIQ